MRDYSDAAHCFSPQSGAFFAAAATPRAAIAIRARAGKSFRPAAISPYF